MAPERVAPLREQPGTPFGDCLPTCPGIWIGEHVDQKGDVAVDQSALGKGGRGENNEENSGEQTGRAGHAAARVDEKREAPKVRGISMITAGTTNTSARNATAIVSASSPPNQAVGL